MSELLVVGGDSVAPDERRLLRLAGWMGIAGRLAPVDAAVRILQDAAPGQLRIVIGADSLIAVDRASRRGLHELLTKASHVLVFGCVGTGAHGTLVNGLTRGAVPDVRADPAGEQVFHLPDTSQPFTRQLAGQSIDGPASDRVSTFALGEARAGIDALMLVNRRPMFIRTVVDACQLFLLTRTPVPDLDETVSRSRGVDAHYHGLIPLITFLRATFGDACWHAIDHTARLIVDDPLLTPRYGFLDYRALLGSMRRHRYATSVAFIPWNHRRTSPRTAAALFTGRPDLSLCVHGCDHTSGEFATADPVVLAGKARLGLDRMHAHEARTGVAWDPVMVFPQGRFSPAAVSALRTTGYLAAVNSTCIPSDGASTPPTMADALEPAVTRFHGFPIFQRRYPRRLFDTAFDLFVGKPALLVEHHDGFRDHGARLEGFIAALQRLEPTLAWPSLGSQLTGTCLVRASRTGHDEVRFFTRRFRLRNGAREPRGYRLAKREPEPATVRAVRVDGHEVPFWFEDGFLRLDVNVNGDGRHGRAIEVVDHTAVPAVPPCMSPMYHGAVALRRALSELRDQRLSRHPRLLRALTRLVTSSRASHAAVASAISSVASPYTSRWRRCRPRLAR